MNTPDEQVDARGMPEELFGGGEDVVSAISKLAEQIAQDMGFYEIASRDVKDAKAKLDADKERLANMLTDAGMKSCKLECGLTPRAKQTRKFFKKAGIDDHQLQSWLHANDLGDIIKPTVNFQTMQATLAAFESQGGDLPPDIFNIQVVPSIAMTGKSVYLASKGL